MRLYLTGGECRPRNATRLMLHRVQLISLALLMFACSVKAESPNTLGGFVERSDEQMLVLSLNTTAHPLHEGIIAYADGDDIFVPLLAMCAALGIPVTGSSAQGHAEGWFRDEGRRFVLDTQQRKLYVDGLARQTDWTRIERHAEDMYLPLDTFSQWFGLNIAPQLNQARLWLSDAADLPAEQRRLRLARWKQHQRATPTVLERGLVVDHSPGWLNWPTIDLNLASSVEPARSTFGANALATGDLLRAEANLSLAWRRNALGAHTSDARLRLQRSPQESGGFGWAGGDVVSPDVPLLLTRSEGLGLSMGTWSEDMQSQAFTTEVRGDALNGWDVELYRNETLLALRTVERDNQYVFENVPLQSGLNVFRILLYGPQGQRRERLQRLMVGTSWMRPDERRWRTYALLPQRRLLHGTDNTSITFDQGERGAVVGAGYQWAVGARAAASVEALSATLTDGERRHYGSARVQGNVLGWWLDGHYLTENTGGQAWRFSAQRNAELSDAGLEYERFDDFISPETERGWSSEQPRDRLRARWNGRLAPRTPIALEAERQRSTSVSRGEARDTAALRLRLSQRWRSTNLSVSAEANRDSTRASAGGASAGMLLSYRRSRFDLNAQLSREFAPRARLRQAGLAAHWALSDRLRLRAQISRLSASRSRDRVDLGLSWTAKRWSVQLGAGTTESGDYRLNMSVFTSLQRGLKGWHADARAASATSSAEAHVFLDNNADGRFDPGDRPLNDIQIRGMANGVSARTDTNGRALLTHLPANGFATLRLQPEGLENPYWLPAAPTVSLRAHAGAYARVAFPVVPTVEIDGTAFIVSSDGHKPAANVLLQLRDHQGVLVREVRTAFDGAYLLDRLPPGDYVLGVSPEQAQRLSLRIPEPRRVVLGEDRDTVTLDWMLTALETRSATSQ
jgi:hypothetical protein